MSSLKLQDSLRYKFENIALLEEALTHSSAVNENPRQYKNNNQRLEFLGDSVLDLVIGNYLYQKLKEDQEGSLSKIRSVIVCEKSLAEIGNRLQIYKFIKLGKSEEIMKINHNASVIADAVEAIIGAIFIDGGYLQANEFVLNIFAETIEKAQAGKIITDFKTKIQELLQREGETQIYYKVDKEEGPPHDRTFQISLWNQGIKLGTGIGKTKKEAEQKAAKAALEVKSVF